MKKITLLGWLVVMLPVLIGALYGWEIPLARFSRKRKARTAS